MTWALSLRPSCTALACLRLTFGPSMLLSDTQGKTYKTPHSVSLFTVHIQFICLYILFIVDIRNTTASYHWSLSFFQQGPTQVTYLNTLVGVMETGVRN